MGMLNQHRDFVLDDRILRNSYGENTARCEDDTVHAGASTFQKSLSWTAQFESVVGSWRESWRESACGGWNRSGERLEAGSLLWQNFISSSASAQNQTCSRYLDFLKGQVGAAEEDVDRSMTSLENACRNTETLEEGQKFVREQKNDREYKTLNVVKAKPLGGRIPKIEIE